MGKQIRMLSIISFDFWLKFALPQTPDPHSLSKITVEKSIEKTIVGVGIENDLVYQSTCSTVILIIERQYLVCDAIHPISRIPFD